MLERKSHRGDNNQQKQMVLLVKYVIINFLVVQILEKLILLSSRLTSLSHSNFNIIILPVLIATKRKSEYDSLRVILSF